MSTSEARLVTAQEVVLGEKGSDLVEQNQYIYIYIYIYIYDNKYQQINILTNVSL